MTEHMGCYEFKCQQGAKGYFAAVSLSIELEPGDCGLEILFEDAANLQWTEAAIVGVRTAWRQVPAKVTAKTSAIVRITKVDWQPGDTTDMLVLFTAANAVFDTLQVEPRQRAEFLLSFGCFVFPK